MLPGDSKHQRLSTCLQARLRLPMPKKELRRSGAEWAISFLEKSWRLAKPISSVSQLEGEWTVQVPTKGDVRKWMSQHGARPSMKLISAPSLNIAADGSGISTTHIRWGLQKGQVKIGVQYNLMGVNVLRERPRLRSFRTTLIGLPPFVAARTLEVVYLDQDLMIVRDPRGVVDVLWRRAVQQTRSVRMPNAIKAVPGAAKVSTDVEHSELHAEGEQQEQQQQHDSHRNKAQQLLDKVASLKSELESQHNETASHRAERLSLTREVAMLRRSLRDATAEVLACQEHLTTAQELESRMLTSTTYQRKKHSEHANLMEVTQMEIEKMNCTANEHRRVAETFEAQEASLLTLMRQIESEMSAADRRVRVGYRAALQKSREELRQAQRSARKARKMEAPILRRLQQATGKFEKMQSVAHASSAAEAAISGLLQKRSDDSAARQARLTQALAKQAAANQTLTNTQARISALAELEVKSQKLASEMQDMIGDVAAHAGQGNRFTERLSRAVRRVLPWR